MEQQEKSTGKWRLPRKLKKKLNHFFFVPYCPSKGEVDGNCIKEEEKDEKWWLLIRPGRYQEDYLLYLEHKKAGTLKSLKGL